jgi:hypothetical protein
MIRPQSSFLPVTSLMFQGVTWPRRCRDWGYRQGSSGRQPYNAKNPKTKGRWYKTR